VSKRCFIAYRPFRDGEINSVYEYVRQSGQGRQRGLNESAYRIISSAAAIRRAAVDRFRRPRPDAEARKGKSVEKEVVYGVHLGDKNE
jgi:hypothetical protein